MMPPFFAELTEALTDAIRYHVRYNTRNEEGQTRAERNARFGMSHLTPPEPEIPIAAEHVWTWFWELSAQRRSGFGGAEPLSWDEIAAWMRLTQTQVIPEEVSMLTAMDLAYRSATSDEQAAKREAREGRFG